jgi:hypothetical protein
MSEAVAESVFGPHPWNQDFEWVPAHVPGGLLDVPGERIPPAVPG